MIKVKSAGGTNTTDANATAAQILAGKTAYVKGVKVTGTIPSKSAATIMPSTANHTIAAGQYLSGAQTIQGDADLKAVNIKKGVNIFGVAGTYEGETNYAGGIANITWASETILCDYGYNTAYYYTTLSLPIAFAAKSIALYFLYNGTTFTGYMNLNFLAGDAANITAPLVHGETLTDNGYENWGDGYARMGHPIVKTTEEDFRARSPLYYTCEGTALYISMMYQADDSRTAANYLYPNYAAFQRCSAVHWYAWGK